MFSFLNSLITAIKDLRLGFHGFYCHLFRSHSQPGFDESIDDSHFHRLSVITTVIINIIFFMNACFVVCRYSNYTRH